MKGLLSFLFIVQCASSKSQIVPATSIDFFSKLNCYSKQFATSFSMEGNPASISFINAPVAGVGCKNRFLINNLNQNAIAIVIPTTRGAVGIQMHSFRYDEFAETKSAVAYAKKLGQIFLGVQFHYHAVRIEGYGSTAALIPEVGTIWKMKENLFAGVTVYRPVSLKKNTSQESFGYNYSTGIGYEISKEVLLAASVQMQEDQPPQFNAALAYQFSQQFFASLGVNCRIGEWHVDAGWKWNSMKIQSLMSYHLQLGLTAGLMLEYEFKSSARARK